MKTRSNRGNNGYIGVVGNFTNGGIIGLNQNTIYREDYFYSDPDFCLPMPNMVEGDQRIAALYRIYPGGSGASGITSSGNFFAFILRGCTYIVDWGDGTTQSYSSGVTAQKQYDFSSISQSTETRSGFRQVIMQAYPSVAGTTFQQAIFNTVFSQPGFTVSTNYTQSMEHLKICSNSLEVLTFATSNTRNASITTFEYVGESNITNFSSMFGSSFTTTMFGLQNIIGTEWTKRGITFSSMFASCSQLKTIPALNCSSGLAFNQMFYNCYGLRTIERINTRSGTNFSEMFLGCSGLESIPSIDTSNATNFASMFKNCYSLTEVPDLNSSKVTNFASMFEGCYLLRRAPRLDTSAASSVATMFRLCASIRSVPEYDLSSASIIAQMFQQCRTIRTIKLINVNSATNALQMFDNCTALKTVALMNASQLSTVSSMFSVCGALESAPLNNLNVSFSYADCGLSPAALNDIFTYAGVTGSGKTLTITNNWGASGCNRSIATAKGWAVAG